MRLDLFLVAHHGFTRNKAQILIELGLILVDGKKVIKPSFLVDENASIQITEDKRVHWVSRSAKKLEGFLIPPLMEGCHEVTGVSDLPTCGGMSRSDRGVGISPIMGDSIPIFPIIGKSCLDVGSSTGGFTQVLLEHGAAHVDAVDVGRDQLHEILRNDPRVTSYEETDIRDFSPKQPYDIIVCDASFVSLSVLFPAILEFANTETNIILLYKPQFEVGRENLRKTGVPKDDKIVAKKLQEWEMFLAESNCQIIQKSPSTLKGEAGNQEWVYWVRRI